MKNNVHPVAIVAICLAIFSGFLPAYRATYVAIASVICSIIGITRPGKATKIISVIGLIIGLFVFVCLYLLEKGVLSW